MCAESTYNACYRTTYFYEYKEAQSPVSCASLRSAAFTPQYEFYAVVWCGAGHRHVRQGECLTAA